MLSKNTDTLFYLNRQRMSPRSMLVWLEEREVDSRLAGRNGISIQVVLVSREARISNDPAHSRQANWQMLNCTISSSCPRGAVVPFPTTN